MSIGIIHLTDLHITKKSDVNSKLDRLAKVVVNDFHGVAKIFILISGDIGFSGKEEEYAIAKKFIGSLRLLIKISLNDVPSEVVIIPGNHDCDFSLDTDLRKKALNNISYETIGNDNSITQISLSIQQPFWNFYSHYHKVPADKLVYSVKENIGGKKIHFHCLNTAWMSQINETPGTLFFPVKKYQDYIKNNSGDINIVTWHHPMNWLNPNTTENNKNEFLRFTESLGVLHFIGHEHENLVYKNVNQFNDMSSHVLSGKLFNDDRKPDVSGFQNIKIDLKVNKGDLKSYSWKNDFFELVNEKDLKLWRDTSRKFSLKVDYKNELTRLRIPFSSPHKKDVLLSDIYVFPDMEPQAKSNLEKLETHVDSSKLLSGDYQHCIVDGEGQIGKSSLLSMLYIKLYEHNYYPLLLSGSDFKNNDLNRILKRAFSKQYIESEFERYLQTDIDKKVLLIDDFHESQLNVTTTKSLIEEATKKFGKVVITLDSTHSILPTMQSEIQGLKFFSLKPLGYKKRNDLIERYYYLKENPLTIDEQNFYEETKLAFDNVQNVLGNKLMPSYPIFILSILQALEYKPLQQQETSYAYCYQTLIHYSLNKAGVINDYIDSYFNFLTELAYDLIIKDTETLTRKDYDEFFNRYRNKFLIPNYETVIGVLKSSKIIYEKDTTLRFGYKYILYYLSAKKISDILHTPEGQGIVKKLFDNLHIEKNANILVFVTHHSKDISFIEESMMNSMIVLDNVPPITLEKNDPFYEAIKGITEGLKNDVLEINKNPRRERERILHESDESERALESKKDSSQIKDESINDQVNSVVRPFQQSFRSIEIIGQIIKNRKGSLTIPKLQEMIKEIYTTGFRTVAFMNQLLTADKDEIIATIAEKTDENDTKLEIEKKINHFVQMLCLNTCLGVFGKLLYSVGNKDLKELYTRVAMDMNTPAAKLVSFSINSYYGSISINELKAIEMELKGNIVAMNILKLRVKSYVYQRNVDFKTKQRIAEILQMNLGKPKVPTKAAVNY